MLRMSNDRYRQVIFNAQVYANMGAGTYEKAVDMATKDFLRAGINCVEYKNGSRHTVEDYTDMAIRTAGKRAYLTGEGEKRKEWGISTVIMNKRGNPCAKCLPFVGKVLIDDVWSGGKQEDGPYQLMSEAIAQGLYHPRCKDSHTTYFPELDNGDDTPTKEEKKEVIDNYNQEQKANYCKTEANKLDRMAKYSLDPDNKRMYQARADRWKDELRSDAQRMNDSLVNSGKSGTIKLEDTSIRRSVGAKVKNYDILDPGTGDYFNFVEGTKIQNSEVFAGSGVKKPLKEEVADGLSKEFGGEPNKWQHAKGIGTLNYNGEDIKAEVHWFQEESVGKVKFKVKEWLDES